jgi:dihydrofolate reductase
MPKVTADMTITLDGYGSGRGQSAEHPFGDIDERRLHAWQIDHRDENTDEASAITVAGAYIMGRNMFDGGRGEWDPEWKGWWGAEPPYHAPVYVLTHHPRESIPMEGGTTFHFVTEGPAAALEQAQAVVGDGSVEIAGGAATANSFLAAGLIDELHLHIAPVVLGRGERLFDGVTGLRLEPVQVLGSPGASHLKYRVRPA